MFDKLFGIHATALVGASDRVSVLAANIANADTPNYKARDYDFAAALAGEGTDGSLPMTATHAGHITTSPGTTTLGELKYRIPFQPSLDGNTVEAAVEQSKFIQNSMRYQASLDFINRRVADMNLAISGQ